jgi:FKBP-type peptidyl-prolyl cis-trans isomerase
MSQDNNSGSAAPAKAMAQLSASAAVTASDAKAAKARMNDSASKPYQTTPVSAGPQTQDGKVSGSDRAAGQTTVSTKFTGGLTGGQAIRKGVKP